MTTNQEGRLSSVQAQTGTALGYNGDFITLFANEGYTSGIWNQDFLNWINGRLQTSYTTLPRAMEEFAASLGFTRWSDVNFIPSDHSIVIPNGDGSVSHLLASDGSNIVASS